MSTYVNLDPTRWEDPPEGVLWSDNFTLLFEQAEGIFYAGPLAPAKAVLREAYPDLEEVDRGKGPGRFTVREEGGGTWGTDETLDAAWRWFAGGAFGPIDDEDDESRLRRALQRHTEMPDPSDPKALERWLTR